MSLRESVLPGRIGEMNLISKASTVHVFEIINRTKLIPISPQLDSWYHLYQNTPETIYASNGILQTSNKKSLPNIELSSDTWRRRADSPGCFTFYAPHDAKAAIKMFAQKGNSSIDEFPFCS